MKNIYSNLVFLIIIFSFSQLEAQTSISDFTITSENLSILGKTLPIPSTLIKTGDTLSWSQSANSNDTIMFTILDTSGIWDITTNEGDMTYNMTLGGSHCLLMLTGTQQAITAKLSFAESNNTNEQKDYTFNVNTMSYQ